MSAQFSRVRFTCYLLQETVDRIQALQRGRPVGYPIDDAFAESAIPVHSALIARKTDRVPVRPHSGPPPKLKPRSDGAHSISCMCEACTLARLETPQVKGKK